jgi:magnesium-transporting ATPase (P-type)
MTVSAATTGSSAGSAMIASDGAWHALTPDEVASRLQVDPAAGLTSAEADARRSTYGRNTFAEPRSLALADVLASTPTRCRSCC